MEASAHDVNVPDVPSSSFPCQTELYDDADAIAPHSQLQQGASHTDFISSLEHFSTTPGGHHFGGSSSHVFPNEHKRDRTATLVTSTDESGSSANQTSYMDLPPRNSGHSYQQHQMHDSFQGQSKTHYTDDSFKWSMGPSASSMLHADPKSIIGGDLNYPTNSHRQMATSLTEASQRTAALSSQLHEAHDKIAVLKSLLQQRDQQYQQANDTLRSREADIDKAKDTVENLAAEIELHRGKHASAEARVAELEQLYARAAQEAHKALATAQQCAERAERDAMTARARAKEAEEHRQTVDERNGQIATLRTRLATLDAEHSTHTAEFTRKCDSLVAEWQGVLSERDQEARLARQEAQSARERLEAMEVRHTTEQQTLRGQLETARDALGTVEAERDELSQMLRALRTRQKALETERDDARAAHAEEMRDLHDTLASERRRLDTLTANGNALLSELEDKKTALHRHDDELQQCKRRLAQAEVEVQRGNNARSIVEAQMREIDAARGEVARESDARARLQRELDRSRAACEDKDATLAQERRAHAVAMEEVLAAARRVEDQLHAEQAARDSLTRQHTSTQHAHEEALAEARTTIDALQRDLDDSATALALEQQISTEYKSREQELQEKIAALEEKVQTMTVELSASNDAHAMEVRELTAAHDRDIKALQDRVATHEEAADELQASAQFNDFELKRRVAELENRANTAAGECQRLQRSLHEQTASQHELESQARQMAVELQETRDALVAARARLGASEDKSRKLERGLDGLRQQADMLAMESGIAGTDGGDAYGSPRQVPSRSQHGGGGGWMLPGASACCRGDDDGRSTSDTSECSTSTGTHDECCHFQHRHHNHHHTHCPHRLAASESASRRPDTVAARPPPQHNTDADMDNANDRKTSSQGRPVAETDDDVVASLSQSLESLVRAVGS
eukprot:m.47841 g.47841  ORF g.47841 m.47841 type:complete len:925 (+) comp15244_c0_seq1:273-3047(+)